VNFFELIFVNGVQCTLVFIVTDNSCLGCILNIEVQH